MKITAKQYAESLHEVLSESGPKDEDRVLDNLVKILSDNGHLGMLDGIADEFRKIDSKKRGEIPVTVTFASAERQPERQVLEELHRVIGKNLSIKKNVEAGIIGGVLIETEDERIDASVRKQLRDLKNTLIH